MLIMTPSASRTLSPILDRRRPPAVPLERRVVYEFARLRVADAREPPMRFAHLAVRHD